MKSFWIIILIIGVIFGYLIGHQYVKAENTKNLPTDKIIIPIVAVNAENGTIGNATFILIAGSGRILLDNKPVIDTDMQAQIDMAVAYAKYYTNKTLDDKDIVIDFDMSGEVVGGVSSGASIAIGTIALLEEKKLNESIVITGMISPDGIMRRVGEIREKATAARDAGYTLFLVPSGQSRYRFMNQTLQEYLNNTIEIKEVATITQAAEIMIIK
jgi:predicted S18 family serine protease